LARVDSAIAEAYEHKFYFYPLPAY
jgi:hypothetical protein